MNDQHATITAYADKLLARHSEATDAASEAPRRPKYWREGKLLFLSKPQVCAVFGISDRTLSRVIASGRGLLGVQPLKHRGRVLWRTSEIAAATGCDEDTLKNIALDVSPIWCAVRPFWKTDGGRKHRERKERRDGEAVVCCDAILP